MPVRKPTTRLQGFLQKRLCFWHRGGVAARSVLTLAACVALSGCAFNPRISSMAPLDRASYEKIRTVAPDAFTGGKLSPEAALAYLGTRSDEELQQMSHRKAVLLLEALLRTEDKDLKHAPIHRLYRNLPLDTAFSASYAQKQAQWYDYARSAKLVAEARKNWLQADNERRKRWMAQILAKHSEFLGIKRPSVALVSEGPRQGCNSGEDGQPITVTTLGYHMLGTIYFNTHEASKWNDFDATLELGVHENRHNFQYRLSQKLHQGRIKHQDPRWNQVALWVLNQRYYVSGCGNFATYWRQPLERDAFTQEQRFHAEVLTPKTQSAQSVPSTPHIH